MTDKYSLVGQDGNVFHVMGYTRRALENEGLKTLRTEYVKKASTLKDYDLILALSLDYLDKANEKANKVREILAINGVKRALDEIYNTFYELMEIYPMKKSELENNGDICYANGNNGTDFDWKENGHISHMFISNKNGKVIYRVTVYSDGDIEGYIVPKNKSKAAVHKKISESDALDLAACLYQNSDEKGYIKWFSKINFNTPIKNKSYEAFEQEEEEEYGWGEDEEEMWGKRTKIPRKAPQTMRRRAQHKKSQPPFKLNVRKMF